MPDVLKIIARFVVYFIVISGVLSLLLYFFPNLQHHEIIFDNFKYPHNILSVHAAAIVLLTMVLICVGWLQLENLNKTSKAEFLLKIVARYSSSEIVEARAVIQRLHRTASPKNETVSEETYIQRMSDGIDNIRDGTDPLTVRECAVLLNLLDFLEAISYFTRKKFISAKDIDELIGNSILFYYKIYKRWIYSRRERYDNNYYYCEFEALAKKIESHLMKLKLAKTCVIIRFFNLFY